MNSDKIKKFIECYVPTETCNLKCHYCYISQVGSKSSIVKYDYPVEHIKKALTRERLGGTCLFNFCAWGETLLDPQTVAVTKAILENGHYIMIVTNGTVTKRFEEIAQFDKELLKRLFFKFSFHFLELKRLNLMDNFFENVNMMKNAGASFTVEITPTDELEEYIDEMKKTCIEKVGAPCHSTLGRVINDDSIPVLTKRSFDEYKEIWGKMNSKLFEFKSEIFYKKRKEFCYAGAWSFNLNLSNGDICQCYARPYMGNIYKDITQPIPEFPVGNTCKQPHCYNGHAFLGLGNIPELETPTYAEMRNKICEDGSEWLKPEMKCFMSTKLKESNNQYSKNEKILWNLRNSKKMFLEKNIERVMKILRRIKKK